MVSRSLPDRSNPAHSPGPSTDAEHNGGRKRYKWQDRGGQSHQRSGNTRNDRRHWRLDRVYKPEPMADEPAGQNEAENTRGYGYKDL